MSLKKLLIITVLLLMGVLLLLGVLLFVSSVPQDGGNVTVPPVDLGGTQIPGSGSPEFPDEFPNEPGVAALPAEQEKTKGEIKLMVRNFVEDLGSFSSNSGYAHIELLYDRMGEDLKASTKGWIKGHPAQERSTIFYSIDTEVIQITFLEFSEDRALIAVSSKRTETDVPEYYNKTFHHDDRVEVKRHEEGWKVESVLAK